MEKRKSNGSTEIRLADFCCLFVCFFSAEFAILFAACFSVPGRYRFIFLVFLTTFFRVNLKGTAVAHQTVTSTSKLCDVFAIIFLLSLGC